MLQATSKQIENAADGQLDTNDLNAMVMVTFFWRNHRDNAYYLFGWAGQLGIILPDYNATITLSSYEFQTQSLLDSVWETLVPQLR